MLTKTTFPILLATLLAWPFSLANAETTRTRATKLQERAVRDVSNPYVPLPWTAGQSHLPPRYQGMDIKWLYRLLEGNSTHLSKSEFETSKEYEDRIRQYVSLPPPLSADQEYAFRVEEFELMHRLSYNADTEEFRTQQFGMICLDADKATEPSQAAVVCDVGDLDRQKNDYVGSNAYGVKRDVESSRSHSFGLAIGKDDPFTKQFLKGYQGFQDSFTVPRERARLLEGKNMGVLFVGNLLDARLIAGQPTIITPTVSNPADIRVKRTAVKFRPTRIVYFIIETGDILFTRTL